MSIYKLTKMDMAKVIVTALYNLDNLVTEDKKVYWKHAVRMASQMKKDEIKIQYDRAYNILLSRSK